MTTFAIRSLLVLLVLIVAAPSYADPNDQKRFDKLGTKYAIPAEDLVDISKKLKPKGGCVCQFDALAGRLGILAYNAGAGDIACLVPQFVGGDYNGFTICPAEFWEILSK